MADSPEIRDQHGDLDDHDGNGIPQLPIRPPELLNNKELSASTLNNNSQLLHQLLGSLQYPNSLPATNGGTDASLPGPPGNIEPVTSVATKTTNSNATSSSSSNGTGSNNTRMVLSCPPFFLGSFY